MKMKTKKGDDDLLGCEEFLGDLLKDILDTSTFTELEKLNEIVKLQQEEIVELKRRRDEDYVQLQEIKEDLNKMKKKQAIEDELLLLQPVFSPTR